MKYHFFVLTLLSCVLAACSNSNEKVEAPNQTTTNDKNLKREINQALTVSKIKEEDISNIPDRSKFHEIPNNFFVLYEVKEQLNKLKEGKNLSGENNFILDSLTRVPGYNKGYDNTEVLMERNSVVKQEKAQKLIEVLTKATANIKDIEYIKVPLTNRPITSESEVQNIGLLGYSNYMSDIKGLLATVQLSNADSSRRLVTDANVGFKIENLDDTKGEQIARLIPKDILFKGDGYFVVTRNQRSQTTYVPAYLDISIFDEKTNTKVLDYPVDKF